MESRKSTFLIIDFAVLIIGMLLCGLLSLSFGKELQWDLAGYHFYNPYAYLNHRMNTLDYWPPSAIQAYITPTFDFLSYYLIQHFSPKTTEFILGALHGINAGLLFYISRFFLAFYIKKPRHQITLALLTTLTGLYAPTVYPGIGAFFNDNIASLFILGFILWWVNILKQYNESKTLPTLPTIFATLLLGMAIGSKITLGFYAIGTFAGFALLRISSHDKLILFFYAVIGTTLGILLTDGYWMWQLWQNFQNPFFPFFNGIFHSPYFPAINWSEPRYVPKGIIEAILFPYYLSAGIKPTVESYFTDYRFAIVYFLFIVFAFVTITQRVGRSNNTISWLYLFFIFTYLSWQTCFSIMRYLNVLQMLAPLVCTLLILQMLNRFTERFLSLLIIFSSLLFFMHPIVMERTNHFGNNYFNVKLPAIITEHTSATVLLPYAAFSKSTRPMPNHYLIPFFPATYHFTGIPFYGHKFEIPAVVLQFVTQGPKQVYLLSSSDYLPDMSAAAKALNLHPNGACAHITSDRQKLSNEEILLCPYEKT